MDRDNIKRVVRDHAEHAGARSMLVLTSAKFTAPTERIRREAEIPTMAVGLITEPTQAESYLAEGRCELVALAREMLWNPNWPAHAVKALGGRDPLDLLPKTYAWWLRRRDQVRKLYPTGNESA